MTETIDTPAVNCHTHLYSGLVPLGMPKPEPPPGNFLEILERVWWKLDRALDEESLRASARYYVAESLLAGTSTLIDHHESPNLIEGSLDILADACDELGARALLCYGATERNGGREEALRGLAECRRFIETNEREGVRGCVGLHGSFTVSDETIRDAGEMCRDLGAITHVHVAEDQADVENAKRRGYEGPMERLQEFGALPAGSIMAHGVHLTETQVKNASAAKLWIIQNPRSNRGNEVGYPKELVHALDVAVGTDGFPARMSDEFEVLHDDVARHEEDATEAERRIAGGWTLVREIFGNVTDEVVREDGRVLSMRVSDRTVVENGCLVNGDIAEIHAYAREQAARLWKKMAEL